MECFNCGSLIIWDADFDFEDYDITDTQGIVHCLHCPTCESDIYYFTPTSKEVTYA